MKVYIKGNTVHIPKVLFAKNIVNKLLFGHGLFSEENESEYIVTLPDSDKKQRIMADIRQESFMNGIETDEAIKQAADEYWEAYHAQRRLYEQKAKERALKSANKARKDCFGCPNLRKTPDDDCPNFICIKTGEVLKESRADIYDYVLGINTLFNRVPVPSENCIYKET